jgi:formate hydrogenlyase transcriptional activator
MATVASCIRQDEPRWSMQREEIIGNSAGLRRALELVEIVGETDATVIILGESGTGKELIARRLHGMSARAGHAFVEVNCAAIPLGLLESELFGHERGAFTGAIAQRIGRFEAADKGTLFLDEIGDIPSELQPKLLRVLQEHQFERLGSSRTMRTNVRLIAATHRNLAHMVDEGKFRVDLYYRLNVFPITLPPLRERRDDIPLLVWHFARKFAHQLGRRIDHIPTNIIEALARHSWTGNVRELQNFIERAVILSRGTTLEAPLSEIELLSAEPVPVTLRDAERAHIQRVLREVNGVIAAAAVRLGVPRSTLFYKLQRLGIGHSQSRRSKKTDERCGTTVNGHAE